MNVTYLVVVMAGSVCVVVFAWLMSGRAGTGRSRPERQSDLRWSVALLAIACYVMILLAEPFQRNHLGAALGIIPVAAGGVILVRPRLIRSTVAVALAVLGLYGFVVARGTGFFVFPGHLYGLVTAGAANLGTYLVLPQAYALLFLGGWLAWREFSRRPWLARKVLGAMAAPDQRAQLWGLMLLPVVAMAAALFTPNEWMGSGLIGAGWTIALLAGSAQIIRRSPSLSARLATAGLIILGATGLYLATGWPSAEWRFPVMPYNYVLYGVVDVTSRAMANVAIAQALLILGFGCWLAPRTVPEVRRLMGRVSEVELTRRVQRLTESRAVAVDTAAADLRRLERDLHDGAQARLVALGMSLRAAERLIPSSPEAAIALVAEAREASGRALTELRELVRGVHPPVLADRGLGDAIRALALDSPLNVQTDVELPGSLPAPIETACYFAVAEVLTNAAKHSGARDARICVSHASGLLRIEVTDFGLGGADPARGTGLVGVEKRLATFDGIVAISSPAGGPTIVVLEVPCALSSPKTSSC
jgi:signal transduction histidine kinase